MGETRAMLSESSLGTPRIEYLRVKNYRALKDLELKQLSSLTVLLGPNGSGKSTVFDVFAFLSECFTEGLRKAMDRRGRFQELRTRGASEPIVIELRYRERPRVAGDVRSYSTTYRLALQAGARGPVVLEERLGWPRTPGKASRPFNFLDFHEGKGTVVSGEMPDETAVRTAQELQSPDILAVSALGQFADHPRVSALRRFITGWYLSYLSADSARGTPEPGPQERLTASGDNLANVIQYLGESHGDRLTQILKTLSDRVPRLEKVTPEMMPDGRLLLLVKDAPFEEPVQARFASDGTLKMLAYLVALNDPEPPPLIGIEEPENHLHPRLLAELAEECREASARSQLMVTTHSPFFVNGLTPEELWILYRDEAGYTKAKRAKDMRGISAFVDHGAKLGDLWMESQFEFGDPLQNQGAPHATRKKRGV